MNRTVLEFLYFFIAFFLLTIFISPIIGTIFSYLNIPWGWTAFFVICALSAIGGLKYRAFFAFKYLKKQSLVLGILLLILCSIYLKYSPVIEVRQDPAVYMFKSFNLINYGHLHKPITSIYELSQKKVIKYKDYKGYGYLMNGTQNYTDDKLHLDFYPGGTYFYALLGQINKDLAFYGPPLIMLAASIILFLILSVFFNPFISAVMTMVFSISPLMVWFGRAPYSEPQLLLVFLTIFHLFNQNSKQKLQLVMPFIIMVFLTGYLTRLDFLFILLGGLIIINYHDLKMGAIFAVLSTITMYLAQDVYFLYYKRISFISRPMFDYDYYLLVGIFALSVVVVKLKWLNIQKILQSNILFYGISFVCLTIILFVYRDNLISPEFFEQEIIHGKMKRTFNENNIDRLLLVFPGFIIVVGLIYLPFLIKSHKIGHLALVFLLGSFLVMSIYFYASGNSPQMYWVLRRYQPVLIPSIYISFCFFIFKTHDHIRLAMIFASLILMLNLYLNSRQSPEMKGLDKSVQEFVAQYGEDDNPLILYDSKLKYQVSSIISYGKYDFMPLKEIDLLNKIFKNIKKRIIYISDNSDNKDRKLENHNLKLSTFRMKHKRKGANHNVLPLKEYNENYAFYIWERAKL